MYLIQCVRIHMAMDGAAYDLWPNPTLRKEVRHT